MRNCLYLITITLLTYNILGIRLIGDVLKYEENAFMSDLSTSQLTNNPSTTLHELLASFYDILRSLPDQHATLIIKTTSRPRFNPWMTSDLLMLKAHRRKLEPMYIQSYLLIDLFKLRCAASIYHKLITSAKRSFNFNLILKSVSSPRLLWKTINSLLHGSPTPDLLQLYPEPFAHRFLLHSSQKRSPNFILNFYLLHLPCLHTSHRLKFFLLLTLSQTSVTEISTLTTDAQILIVISILFKEVYSYSYPLLSHPPSAILSTFLFPQAPSHPH